MGGIPHEDDPIADPLVDVDLPDGKGQISGGVTVSLVLGYSGKSRDKGIKAAKERVRPSREKPFPVGIREQQEKESSPFGDREEKENEAGAQKITPCRVEKGSRELLPFGKEEGASEIGVPVGGNSAIILSQPRKLPDS